MNFMATLSSSSATAYFNARDFFAPKSDNLKRNQFGGTLGGPIKKNKLFFFLGYQGTLIRSAPAATPAVVPTAAELEGNFQAYESQCFTNAQNLESAVCEQHSSAFAHQPAGARVRQATSRRSPTLAATPPSRKSPIKTSTWAWRKSITRSAPSNPSSRAILALTA